jgi:hypothetical protein
MTIARYKDLCLDTNDATVLGPFWLRALGAQLDNQWEAVTRLDPGPGRPSNEVLWINQVPEPRTVKTRVHLDIRLAEPDPAPLVDAGAQVVRTPGKDHWWVLTDPEGNEFCAFPPDEGDGEPGIFQLAVDSRDPVAQAQWWAGVAGGTVHQRGDFAWIEGAGGFPWGSWFFQAVPEPKTVKNRMHWDVDLADPEPAALVAAGAVVLREPDDDIRWWVMADPEGNEFCAFAPSDN